MNNNFMFIGRITKDLELKITSNDKKVLVLPLAISNSKDDTTFINVVLFNSIAETTSKYCKKNDLVAVRGIIKNHNWEDKQNQKHYDLQFLASNISFLSMRKEQKQQVPQNIESKYDEKSDIVIQDSDLPF